MRNHLRGNLLLLGLTVLICCVAYPLILYGIGQTVFHDRAEGSLVTTPWFLSDVELGESQEFRRCYVAETAEIPYTEEVGRQGPEKPRPPVKNWSALRLLPLARITTANVTRTNTAKMAMFAPGFPTVEPAASTLTWPPPTLTRALLL